MAKGSGFEINSEKERFDKNLKIDKLQNNSNPRFFLPYDYS